MTSTCFRPGIHVTLATGQYTWVIFCCLTHTRFPISILDVPLDITHQLNAPSRLCVIKSTGFGPGVYVINTTEQ